LCAASPPKRLMAKGNDSLLMNNEALPGSILS